MTIAAFDFFSDLAEEVDEIIEDSDDAINEVLGE